MQYFVDSADIGTVKQIDSYFPIDGFTTNPNILTKAPRPLDQMFTEYRAYVMEYARKIFVQVTAVRAGDMVDQAVRLHEFFGDLLVVKLPAVEDGYRACKICKQRGIAVCITVVHSVMQALVAAEAGADYTAPYISHIDNIGADGVRCVGEIVKAFDRAHYECKVLGASFRTVDQIEKLAIEGCHSVTIAPDMFKALIAHPSTDVSMLGFNKAWTDTFGDKQVTDFLPKA